MKLTDKQRAALLDAKKRGGLFQLPERATHSPGVLSWLCKAGLLERKPVGVIWELTPAGMEAVNAANSAR